MATSFTGWGASWLDSWGELTPGSADVKVSWLQFDTAATPVDVRVSWLQFDTAATPVDVRVSWLQFDTAAVPVDVKISWLQFDSAAYQPPTVRYADTDQGMAGKNPPERNYYAEWLNREHERKSRLQRDDQLAAEFIMMLVQTELLDGTI